MNSDRIREIQEQTAYPESRSVAQALVQVWHEVGAELESVRTERDALRVMLRRSNVRVERRGSPRRVEINIRTVATASDSNERLGDAQKKVRGMYLVERRTCAR